MLSKDIFVPLTICIDQTRRALVIVLPCYGALEIVGVIIIIIIQCRKWVLKHSWVSEEHCNFCQWGSKCILEFTIAVKGQLLLLFAAIA